METCHKIKTTLPEEQREAPSLLQSLVITITLVQGLIPASGAVSGGLCWTVVSIFLRLIVVLFSEYQALDAHAME